MTVFTKASEKVGFSKYENSNDDNVGKRGLWTPLFEEVEFKQVNSPKVGWIMFILGKARYLNIIKKTDS